MVTEKSTGDVFAMKVMRKAHILQQADVSVLAPLELRFCFLYLSSLSTSLPLFSLSLSSPLLPFSFSLSPGCILQ